MHPTAALAAPLTRAEQARVNGARSAGPVTPEGKARSALNAVRHGLCSRQFWLLPDEDPAELARLRAALVLELRPEGAAQMEIAETVVECWWRRRRASRLEAQILADSLAADTHDEQARAMRALATLIRYRARIERERESALASLASLQEAAAERAEPVAATAPRSALEAAADALIDPATWAPVRPRTNEPEPPTVAPAAAPASPAARPLNRHQRRRIEALQRQREARAA